MAMVGSKPEDGATGLARAADTSRASGRLLRGIGWLTATICVATPVLLALGFLWFIWRLPGDAGCADPQCRRHRRAHRRRLAHQRRDRTAGGRPRPAPAHQRRQPRHQPRRDFASQSGIRALVRCCVDFDRSLNTLGNAIETRRWAERRGFRSLIVVTSNYHMPRAMTEIAHQLPDAALVPFPVVSDRLKAEPWWASGATTRLLLSEYLKYIFAQVRIRLNPAYGTRAGLRPATVESLHQIAPVRARPLDRLQRPVLSEPARALHRGDADAGACRGGLIVEVVRFWARTNLWLLRVVCGIKVEYRGLAKALAGRCWSPPSTSRCGRPSRCCRCLPIRPSFSSAS